LRPFAPHTHSTFSIGLVRTGVNVFRRGRARARAEAGCICVIDPGDVHTGGEACVEWSLCNLYPSEDQLGLVVEDLTGRPRPAPRFRIPSFRDPVVAHRLEVLFATLRGPSVRLERETAFFGAMAALVLRHGELGSGPPRSAPDPRAVRLARDHLHAHLAQSVSLGALSVVAGTSRFHLLRLFRAATGMPPHAYQVMLRLDRAKRAILAGTPIARAAMDSGFADQAHLTRHFRRAYGVTPGQVARACR
jgi:AraC-like DNA-binding protein